LLNVVDLPGSDAFEGVWLIINSDGEFSLDSLVAVPLPLGDLGTSASDPDGDTGGDVDADVPVRALSSCGGFCCGAAASGCAPLESGSSGGTCSARSGGDFEVAGDSNTNGIFR
jgi:hypothetical protein